MVELADAYLARPEVIPIAETAKGQRFTTRAIWELEQGALASAEAMASRSDCAVVDELTVARVLSQRPSIKPDQEAMVRRLLGGGEGLVVVVGEAGTGKTYATVAATRGWAEGGNELRVAAPTWRAANVLGSEGLNATSVARLLAELDRGTAAGEQALAREAGPDWRSRPARRDRGGRALRGDRVEDRGDPPRRSDPPPRRA